MYPLVQTLQPEMASKITGMLLEMDMPEIIHLLENEQSLRSKVDEAMAVLQAHRAKELAKKD